MNAQPSIQDRIHALRRQGIRGKCIDFIPYTAEFASDVVRLRKLPEARHFMSQAAPSTLSTQSAWHQGYLERSNDLFWLMLDKGGAVLGCNLLYDISSEVAEKGSLIVDQQSARTAPVALEGDLLILKFAFEELGLRHVITTVRQDNAKVLSMNERLGFMPVASKSVGGVSYNVLTPERARFEPGRFDQVVDYWSTRHEHRKA